MDSFSAKLNFSLRCAGKFFVLIVLLFGVAFAERLPVRVYKTADGLESSAVNRLFYDSRGFMWFCTRDGLSRFDGYRFTNYKLNGATTASMFDFIERRNGDYLVVGQDGDVYRFDAKTPVIESDADNFPLLNAEKIYENISGKLFEDSDGILWIIGDFGLRRIQETEGKFSAVQFPISLPEGMKTSVFQIIEDSEKTFWMTTNRGLLRLAKDGQILAFYTTPPPTAVRTYATYVFADVSGRIWVSSQDGIYVLKPETNAEPRPFTENIKNKLPENAGEIVKFTTADGLNGQIVVAFHQTVDGRIWIVTNGGLTVFNGQTFRNFGAENGIGEFLTDIAEDENGNLWLASMSGVFKLITDGFSTYTKADGLGRTDISAIYQNKNGEIFTAEGDWFVSRFTGEKFISALPNLGENRGAPLWTSNISFLDSAGAWWFLTEKKLFRFDVSKQIEDLPNARPAAIFQSGEEFKNGAFYRLFEDSKGDVWISLRSSKTEELGLNLWRRAENKIYKFGETENFPFGKSPSAFCEDLNGNLWIGFYHGGLARYKNGKFQVFSKSDNLPPGFITALHLDRSGKLWLTTTDSGVHVVEDVLAEKPVFRKIEGISSNNARALTEDSLGRIYVGTVRGIDRISPETNQILHFSSLDGLADDFVTTALRDQSGALWFGTRNGLSRLLPKADKPLDAPPILIAGLRIAGEKQKVSELGEIQVGKLELDYTQNNLQIDFFSVGFASPEQIRYQFKLEGADSDWSKPTPERTVNYSNLAAGEYRFFVRAVNSQGLTSENPAIFIFRIASPFWKTWWFLTLGSLLVVAIIYYLLRLRFQRRLELEKVRTRIATDLHDDIGASLSRISMLSEIVKHQNGDTNPDSAKRLTQIASDARGLVDSMSDIVWAINPRKDSIESVVDRVCSFAADTLSTKGVHWTVESPTELNHLHLSAEQKRNLYLIFKEAVHNSARHSECKNARLKIRLERGNLIAEIFDDGKGFSSEYKSDTKSLGGRGLTNMQTRAKEIGGHLHFESKKDSGTKMIFTLPLESYRINGWFRFGRR